MMNMINYIIYIHSVLDTYIASYMHCDHHYTKEYVQYNGYPYTVILVLASYYLQLFLITKCKNLAR